MVRLSRGIAGVIAIAATGMVAGCGKPEPGNAVVTDMNATNSEPANVADQLGNSTASLQPGPTPTPNFQEQEGTHYLYVSAVSDDDRKTGKAIGDVIQYEYEGEIDGRLILLQVAESGYVIARIECSRDCRIMKVTSSTGMVSRIPYDTTSIGGAAMEDAMNGFLKAIPREPARRVVDAIPRSTDTSSTPSFDDHPQIGGDNAT